MKKEPESDRLSLVRRKADPQERVKKNDLDAVVSPQRQSFAGGCHVTTAVAPNTLAVHWRKTVLSFASLVDEGLARIIFATAFEKDQHLSGKDLRDLRDRDKDKCFRREFRDSKRVFAEHRRNDSYTEEEAEWFSAVSLKP